MNPPDLADSETEGHEGCHPDCLHFEDPLQPGLLPAQGEATLGRRRGVSAVMNRLGCPNKDRKL